ncbi:Hypothetical predicted protein [Lecanosticta acicola]|uniref:Myb-like domain-containing protein n=1 Tax=Lecanosticta acicola TaxID=111012 RepID=A0AAI8YVV0_9PEZI|nr:Hypothetical predicted protein [Lecanosticta acicola]
MSENAQSHRCQCQCRQCRRQSQSQKDQWTPAEEHHLLTAVSDLLQTTTLHQESDFWNVVISLLPQDTFRSAKAAKNKYDRLTGGTINVRAFLRRQHRQAMAAAREQAEKEAREAEFADVDVAGFTTEPEEDWMDDYTGVSASGPAWDDGVREVWGEKVRDLNWKAELVVGRTRVVGGES